MTKPAGQNVEVLYINHYRWLVSWLRRQLHCADNAADLAQDIFVRLLHRPQLIENVFEPRAWLTTVAKRLLIDKIRRERLERAYTDVLAQMPEPEMPSPEVQLQLFQALETIDILLDGLGEKPRMAFLMSRLDGLTYPDIAVQLGISLSSVEKYMAKAIRHCFLLQQRLLHEGENLA